MKSTTGTILGSMVVAAGATTARQIKELGRPTLRPTIGAAVAAFGLLMLAAPAPRLAVALAALYALSSLVVNGAAAFGAVNNLITTNPKES